MRQKNKMKSLGFLCCIMVILTLGMCPLAVRAESVQADPLQSDKGCTVERLGDAKEAAQAVLEDWEQDYYGEILVHENSNRIEIDGEKDTFTDTFSANAKEMREAVSSQDNLSRFLDEKTVDEGKIYEVDQKEEGLYSLTSPY